MAEEMLGQWSKQILEAWIGNFARLLPLLARSNNGSRSAIFVQKGVNLVQRLSQRTETLAVRTSSALLIGAMADQNSLLSVQAFNQHILETVKNICQDFNWEVRKEICGQLPFVGKYMGAAASYEHLYPELVELIDDEEREVVTTAIQAFGELVEQYLNTDPSVNNTIADLAAVRATLNAQLKKMLTHENFLQKMEISRFLLVNAPWIATLIDLPDDEELQQALLSLLRSWHPGPNNRHVPDDYEQQHMALALQNISKLY